MDSFATSCSKFARRFAALLVEERAATAIEYAMIAAGVGAAIAATVYGLGTQVTDLYQRVSDNMR